MQNVSIKKNILLSGLNTFITLAFPLITFPYVSRILMPEGMGQYNFIVSLVSYFLLFASLGIPLYATKKIAGLKNNQEELKKVASEIFFFNLLVSVFVFLLYIGFIFIDPKGKVNVSLYLIIGLQIFSTVLGVEWYFQAHEKFGYIALRNLLTKLLCIVLIFLLIKSSKDVFNYACIMVLSVLLYSLVNLFAFIKLVKPSIKALSFKKHIRPILGVFILHIASKLNASLDTVMLGYMVGDYAVGQYVAATKVINMIIEILLIINTVLLPRLSSYLSDNRREEALKLLKKSFILIFACSVPAAIGLGFTSNEIILILSGSNYQEAIRTMIIMCSNVFFVIFINFFGVQVLYVFGRANNTTIAISLGAVVNLILNLILIPKLGHMGAGITTLISNFLTFIVQAIFVIKYCKFNVLNKENLKTLIASVAMIILLFFLQFYHVAANNIVVSLIIKVGSAAVIYAALLIFMRHYLFLSVWYTLKNMSIFKRKHTPKY